MTERSSERIETSEQLPRIQPMIPQKTGAIPKDQKNYISEIIFNGMRSVVYIYRGGGVEVITRNGTNVVENFPKLKEGFTKMSANHSFIFDGIIITGEGKTEKERSQVEFRAKLPPQINPPHTFSFIAIDLLYFDGLDLRDLALADRKKKLTSHLRSRSFYPKHYGILSIPYKRTHHEDTLAAALEKGYEGIILKRLIGRYSHTFPKNWLKLKPTKG